MTSAARTSRLHVAPAGGPELERKYTLPTLPLARFLREVDGRLAPEVHDPARPVQYTRTTYLDTAELAYYRSGAPEPRVRLRIREYASARSVQEPPALTGLCFLELKESEGERRRKVRWSAPSVVIRALVASGGKMPADVGAPVELLERLERDRPQPVVTTWYRRRSLASPEGVRITVDDSVWFCRPSRAGAPGLLAAPDDALAVLPPHVLEIKRTGVAPAWLDAAMAGLPEPVEASKFRLAMSALDQTLR